MSRLNKRLAILLLGAAALAGCAGVDATAEKPATSATGSVYPKAMSADLLTDLHNAQVLRGVGDYAGATKILSQLMLVSPDDPRIVSEYGKLLAQEGKGADAVNFLTRGIELKPADYTLYSALGVAFDQLGKPDDAKRAYEHALAIKPGDGAVLNNYGLSRMLAGDVDAAQRYLKQASDSGITDPKIASNIALLESYRPKHVADLTAPQTATPAAHAIEKRSVSIVAQSLASPAAAVAAPAPLAQNLPPLHARSRSAKKVATTFRPVRPVVHAKPKHLAASKDKTPALRLSAGL